MTLPEISLCLAFAALVATASLSLVTDSWQQAARLRQVERQGTDLAILRSFIGRVVEQADRVGVFTDEESARRFDVGQRALRGSCIAMQFASETPVTLEYRSEEGRLWVCSSPTEQWVVLSALRSCSFSVEKGVLRMEFMQRGHPWEILAAIN